MASGCCGWRRRPPQVSTGARKRRTWRIFTSATQVMPKRFEEKAAMRLVFAMHERDLEHHRRGGAADAHVEAEVEEVFLVLHELAASRRGDTVLLRDLPDFHEAQHEIHRRFAARAKTPIEISVGGFHGIDGLRLGGSVRGRWSATSTGSRRMQQVLGRRSAACSRNGSVATTQQHREQRWKPRRPSPLPQMGNQVSRTQEIRPARRARARSRPRSTSQTHGEHVAEVF